MAFRARKENLELSKEVRTQKENGLSKKKISNQSVNPSILERDSGGSMGSLRDKVFEGWDLQKGYDSGRFGAPDWLSWLSV